MLTNMNARQRAFADNFLRCGNAAEAAREAGYSVRTARSIGQRLLTNVDISAYIAERMREQNERRIAKANEVLGFLSAVMRGKVKDAFGMDAALSDRLTAAKELMKRYAATGEAADVEDSEAYFEAAKLPGRIDFDT